MSTPYIGFGNDSLERQPKVEAGDLITCGRCGDPHELEAELETYRSIYGKLSSRPELDKRLHRLAEKHRHQLKIMSDFSREARRAQREGDIERADEMQAQAVRVLEVEIRGKLIPKKQEVRRQIERLKRTEK